MRKVLAVLVLALVAFYVAWPAWSGYRIQQAFQADDAALLSRKVDFPLVRQSLRPVVAAEVRSTVERLGRGSGALGQILAANIKDDLIERIADATVETVVTPEAVIRMVRQGGDLRDAFRRVMAEQVGRNGTLTGRRGAPEPAPPSDPAPRPAAGAPPASPGSGETRKFGFANVKSFAVTGPASFQVGLARDAAATVPDAHVEMAFSGFDWKVVGVIPRPLKPS